MYRDKFDITTAWFPHFILILSNTAIFSVLIFIPLIAKEYGANTATIGFLVAIYNGAAFLSSAVFGRLADLKGGKFFIITGLLFSAIIFFSHRFANNLYSLFLVRCMAGVAIGMFPGAMTAYVYRGNKKLNFFTAAGALGWGIGSVIAGVISEYSLIFMFSGISFLLTFFIALTFLKTKETYIKEPFFDTAVFKKNIRVYLSVFLRHSGACTVWAIYPLFLVELGANKLWISIIYGINAFSQVIFMLFLGRFKSEKLITSGLIFSIITFIGFGLSKNHYQILPWQFLLALSWATLYFGSLKYLIERNKEHSTVTGMLNSTFSLSGITGALIGGAIGTFGYRAVIISAVLFSIAGFVCFIKR